LLRRTISVGGVERTFQMAAPPSRQPAPLLVVLHGLGMTGSHMAVWTGLASRGPEAGFATVFPDGWKEMWDGHGRGRSDGIDDAAFIDALVDRLVFEGVAREGMLVLAGMSNGASFAERLARHGLVRASAVVLVAGTARESSRRIAPRPARPTAVLCLVGTGDPLLPYGGGRASGPLGWMARRRTRRLLVEPDDGSVVGAEVVAADWAATNGCPAVPSVVAVPATPGEPPVEKLTWWAPGVRPWSSTASWAAVTSGRVDRSSCPPS
jgi:poly(3-hydroxybutyrate) depolymerase